MTDRPIIFSTPMILALLEGRKTQTRRLAWQERHLIRADGSVDALMPIRPWPSSWQRVRPGDRLWVRETFSESDPEVVYRADHIDADTAGWGWRPSIHCPRWASRLTLTVTGVRQQRLQEISEHDARAEGIERFRSGTEMLFGVSGPGGYWHSGLSARETFESLWCDLHGPSGWRDNPEVVALTFTTARRNIDAQEAK